MEINELLLNIVLDEEDRDMVETLRIMSDEYEIFKTIAERLRVDPGYYYDLDVILDAAGVEHYYVGKKRDKSNKNLIIPPLHMVVITQEKFDPDDKEWIIKKVEVIRL